MGNAREVEALLDLGADPDVPQHDRFRPCPPACSAWLLAVSFGAHNPQCCSSLAERGRAQDVSSAHCGTAGVGMLRPEPEPRPERTTAYGGKDCAVWGSRLRGQRGRHVKICDLMLAFGADKDVRNRDRCGDERIQPCCLLGPAFFPCVAPARCKREARAQALTVGAGAAERGLGAVGARAARGGAHA